MHHDRITKKLNKYTHLSFICMSNWNEITDLLNAVELLILLYFLHWCLCIFSFSLLLRYVLHRLLHHQHNHLSKLGVTFLNLINYCNMATKVNSKLSKKIIFQRPSGAAFLTLVAIFLNWFEQKMMLMPFTSCISVPIQL